MDRFLLPKNVAKQIRDSEKAADEVASDRLKAAYSPDRVPQLPTDLQSQIWNLQIWNCLILTSYSPIKLIFVGNPKPSRSRLPHGCIMEWVRDCATDSCDVVAVFLFRSRIVHTPYAESYAHSLGILAWCGNTFHIFSRAF